MEIAASSCPHPSAKASSVPAQSNLPSLDVNFPDDDDGRVIVVREPVEAATAFRRIGPYRLIRYCRRDSSGSVWYARMMGRQDIVRLRVTKRNGTESSDRLLLNAIGATRLSHPGIARVREVSSTKERILIATEPVRGVSLAARVAKRPLAIRHAIAIVAKLADALEHAHCHGVTHGGLTLDRIILARNSMRRKAAQLPATVADVRGGAADSRAGIDRPVIVDFGLTPTRRTTGERSRRDDDIGFVSPELIGGTAVPDHRCDVYSLGAILYSLLTGEPPYGNGSRNVDEFVKGRLVAPRKLNRSIPAALEHIVLQCMDCDPAKRTLSAGEVATALRQWLRAGSTGLSWRFGVARFQAAARAICAIAATIALVVAIFPTEYLPHTGYPQRSQADRPADATMLAKADPLVATVPSEADEDSDAGLADAILANEAEAFDPIDEEDLSGVAVAETAPERLLEPPGANPENVAVWQSRLAEAYADMAALQFQSKQVDRAIQNLTRSLEIRQAVADRDPFAVRWQIALADCYGELALYYAKSNRAIEAGPLAAQARRIGDRILEDHPTDPDRLHAFGRLLNNIGCVNFSLGDYNAAVESFQRARQAYEGAVAQNATDSKTLAGLAESTSNLEIARRATKSHK